MYAEHPAWEHMRSMIRNLKQRTGRTLEEWIPLVKEHGEAWLKEQKLGRDTTGTILENLAGEPAYTPEAWADAQYAGPKSALRPIYDRIIEVVRALGPDVRICPTTTFVGFYRKRQFAVVKPTTRTRVDLGLALLDEGLKPAKNLGSDRIKGALGLTRVEDVDTAVEGLLRRAYACDS